MKTMMDRLQVEDDKLNLELEESHGDYENMRSIFEKRIDLYKCFLKEESLTELDRLRLENKREWTVSHLLNQLTHHLLSFCCIEDEISNFIWI